MNKLKSFLMGIFLIFFLAFPLAGEAAGEISIKAVPDSGQAPLTVAFSLQSDSLPDYYEWDFNNDGVPESTEANPTYTYAAAGTYTAKVTTSLGLAETKIIVKNEIVISVVANPASGEAPLAVQFTAVASGGEGAFSYAWDFNGDRTVDSTQQNPVYTFSLPGEYNTTLAVTDASGSQTTKVIPLAVTKYDSHLNLSSCFPAKLTLGENQITCLLSNEGTEPVVMITAKIVGTGIQHLTSTNIPTLNPGDQDSLTVKINVLQAGSLAATLKVADKNFPLALEVASAAQYSPEELQAELNKLKEQFNQQKTVYDEKKSQGYPVSEIADSLKSIQKQIQDTQQQLLTNKLSEARVGLELLTTAISDLTVDLGKVKKQKQTLLMWLKENALAITAVIAAFGAVSGVLVKMLSHAKKVKEQAQKLGQDMKTKLPFKKLSLKKEDLARPEQKHPKPEHKEQKIEQEGKTEPEGETREVLKKEERLGGGGKEGEQTFSSKEEGKEYI